MSPCLRWRESCLMNFPPSLRGTTVCAITLVVAAAITSAQTIASDTGQPSAQPRFTPSASPAHTVSPDSTAVQQFSPIPSLPLAKALIAKQRWDNALAVLAVLRGRAGVEQTEVLFLSALAEIGRQRYSSAAEFLRTILDSRPKLLRVRLELARALFLDGDDSASRHHFEYVLAAKPPPAVAANVRVFLDQIRARRGWRLWSNFGIAPDSNFNTAPSGETICIGSLCGFVLSEDARSKSGTGWFAAVGGEWRKNLGDNHQFVFDSAIHHRDYPDRIADDQTVRISPGLRFLRDRGVVKWSLIKDRRWLNGNPYSRGSGTAVSNEHRPFPRLRLEESAEITRRRHDRGGESRDGDTTSVALRATFAISRVSAMRAHLEATEVRAETPLNSSFSPSLFLQYRRDFPAAINASIGTRWSRSLYDGINRLGGVRRRDSYRALTLTLLKRNWRLFGFAPELSVTWSENNSNLDINTYRRTHGGLSFTREF